MIQEQKLHLQISEQRTSVHAPNNGVIAEIAVSSHKGVLGGESIEYQVNAVIIEKKISIRKFLTNPPPFFPIIQCRY
jgi:hypothetical protein